MTPPMKIVSIIGPIVPPSEIKKQVLEELEELKY